MKSISCLRNLWCHLGTSSFKIEKFHNKNPFSRIGECKIIFSECQLFQNECTIISAECKDF